MVHSQSLLRTLAPLLLIACVVTSLAPGVNGYAYGDHVNMLKMTQYRGYRTAWTELVSRYTPRFGMDRTVKLHAMSSSKTYSAFEEFKISFAFDHENFLTSWITITDGKGHFLNYIEIDFIYAGDHIQSVKWQAVYYEDEHKGDRSDYVFIRYHWKELVESDAATGLNVLLIASLIVAYTCGAMIVIGFDKKKVKRTKAV